MHLWICPEDNLLLDFLVLPQPSNPNPLTCLHLYVPMGYMELVQLFWCKLKNHAGFHQQLLEHLTPWPYPCPCHGVWHPYLSQGKHHWGTDMLRYEPQPFFPVKGIPTWNCPGPNPVHGLIHKRLLRLDTGLHLWALPDMTESIILHWPGFPPRLNGDVLY